MARFIAIPVAQGDSFYLQRGDWSVLVDGGRNQSGFACTFRTATEADGVSIVVCTHNDADHARGILGFLNAAFMCEEMWLPGRWLAVLPDVLKPFIEVFIELATNVAEINAFSLTESLQSDLSPIEAYGEALHGPLDQDPLSDEGPPVGEDGWPDPYVSMLEKAERWEVAPRARLYRYYRRLNPIGVQLLWSAIYAATRIRAIAINTFHRGIPVRWFEFAATQPSGGIAALRPVNSRAVARVRPRVGPLLSWLALTVSNKESLVFWSPPTKGCPGVLFSADSDLTGVDLPSQLSGAIATAPHHGSEANAKAYAVIARALEGSSSSITWVRSDGRYRSRPGPTYRGISYRRLCTRCRLNGPAFSPPQRVHLFARRGVWTRHRNTATCSCQSVNY